MPRRSQSPGIWLTRSILLARVALVLAFSLTVTGCNQEEPPQTEETVLQVLRVNASQDPQSLDPSKLIDTETSVFVTAQFAPLFLVGRDDSLVPILAAEVQSSADGRTARVRLRDDAFFSDGSPVRAVDVRYTFERLYSAQHPQRFVVERVIGISGADPSQGKHAEGFQIDSDRELTIRFDPPDPTWPRLVANAFCGIVKEGSGGAQPKPLDGHLIGAGPFVLEKAEPGGLYRFRANPGFPLQSPANSLDIVVLPNEQDAITRAAAGKLDLVRVRANQLGNAIKTVPSGPRIESAVAGFRVVAVPADDLVYLLVNWRHPVFAGLSPARMAAWREKLNRSIDRAGLVAQVYAGQASPADRPMRSGAAGLPLEPAASWETVSSLELLTPPLGELRQVADKVQADMRVAGLGVSVRLVSVADFIERLGKSEYQVAVLWLESNVSVPELSWATFFQDGGAASLFGDPLDSISGPLSEARSMPAGATRDEALKHIMDAINGRQTRIMPLVHRTAVFLAADAVDEPGVDRNGVMHFSLTRTSPSLKK